MSLVALTAGALSSCSTAAPPSLRAIGTPPAEAVPLVASPLGPRTVPVTGDVTGVHDPALVRQGGTYYLYSTGGGIGTRSSPDLVHWHHEPDVFSELPGWIRRTDPRFSDLWAPDLSFWNGEWHLYYAVAVFGTRDAVIGLATNPTLDPHDRRYCWRDHGLVLRSTGPPVIEAQTPGLPDWTAIDPNVVEDDRGSEWLLWGSFAGGIFVQRLLGDGMLDPSSSPVNIARRPLRDIGAIEGAFMIHRGRWWYLLGSFDLCCHGVDSNYNIRVGRARFITGPFIDQSGVPMLSGGGTFVLAGYGNVYGPGGEGVLREGSTWWLVHHVYDGANRGVPTLSIRPLDWGTAGWPIAKGWDPSIPRPPFGGTSSS